MFKGKPHKDKVKCIYIDPPFNTGNAFDKYDDNLKHSEWLTMMRDRLILLKKLLRKDGIFIVQLDDKEVHYAKVLTDEIFGRDNFISTIAVLSSTPSGVKTAHREKTIIKTKDLILVYKKGRNIKINPQYKPKNQWDSHFNFFFDKETNEIVPLKEEVNKRGIYDNFVSIKDYNPSNGKFKKFYLECKNQICQTGKTMPEEIRKESLKPSNKNKVIPYNSKDSTQYAFNGRRLSFLNSSIHSFKRYSPSEGGWIDKEDISILLCDFWDDINYNNTQNEGGVSFPASKKPEELMFRLIELFTDEGELVMDSFLGSGTTAAVAHKMKRKYIGIELGRHAETHCIKRLMNVISGKDQDKKKYGGGFKYYKLGESLISDKDINWKLTYREIAEALFYVKNFKLIEDKELEKKGFYLGQNLNQKNVFAVCSVSKDIDFVRSENYFSIIEKIKKEHDFEELNIYTNKAVNVRKSDQDESVFIRKIPQTILKKYKLM